MGCVNSKIKSFGRKLRHSPKGTTVTSTISTTTALGTAPLVIPAVISTTTSSPPSPLSGNPIVIHSTPSTTTTTTGPGPPPLSTATDSSRCPPVATLVIAAPHLTCTTIATTPTTTPAATPPGSPPSGMIVASTAPSTKSTLGLWERAAEKLRNEGRGDLTSGKQCDIQLIRTLIKEIEQKKQDCDEKRWFYIKNGEKVFFVETLLGQLNKYAQVGDLAVQHHPDIVALVWSGFRFLLQVGTAYTEHMKAVSDTLEYLVRILCYCDIYEKLYCRVALESTGLLNTSLVDLYVSILEYVHYASIYLDKNTVARVLDSVFSELGQLLSKALKGTADHLIINPAAAIERSDEEQRIKDLRKTLATIREPIGRIESTVEAVFAHVERQRRLEILTWLSSAQYYDHHTYSSRRRHDDTSHWLLENSKYVDWERSNSSSILWLRGDAGSGKTMLASKIIDRFRTRTDHHALAYFYCYFKDSDRDDPDKILRALVKQICLSSPDERLPAQLLLLYEDREKEAHSSGPLKIQESQDLIIKLSEDFWQTTIVIDALDECNPKTRRCLFHALNEIVSATKQVKIFVTGRNDGDIREMLVDFPSHYIDATDNTTDINKYIDSEVERRCNPKRLIGGEKSLLKGEAGLELQEKVISTLKRKAGGMFMWVHFQIIAICEEHTAGDVEEALEKLPKDLDTTYKEVFERIDSQTEAASTVARIVLRWILYANDTKPDIVIQRLAVEPMGNTVNKGKLGWTVSSVLDICKNLLVHDEELNRFRFAHLSIQEYLQRQPEFGHVEENQTGIAEVCLTALTSCYMETNLIPDFLHYSTLYWGEHTRLSGTGSSTLESLCKIFLISSPAYEIWCLNIMKTDTTLRGLESGGVLPLWTACYYGLQNITKTLLQASGNPNCVNEKLYTPLMAAAMMGYTDIVQILIGDDRVEVNFGGSHGQAPLLVAVNHGYKDIVKILLEKDGIDVNCKSEDGITPLLSSAICGNQDIMQMLLEMDGIDINCKTADTHSTPLSTSISLDRIEIVQMLLEKDGIDINCKTKDARTPLIIATHKGNKDIVQMLLEKDGIDVNCREKDGITPLHLAAQDGYREIVQMLLEKDGIEVNCKTQDGLTPLHLTVRQRYREIVRMLRGHGAGL